MRKWLPLVAVCLGTFMLLVDVTIVVVALPDMAESLRTSFADLQWVMDVYALALAALLLGVGSLADRVGHRQVYVVGLVLFALASLACGLATGPAALIAFRGVQGIGGAAMLATTTALISSIYQGRDRGVAFGAWGAVSGAASAAGPVLGGLLTEHLDWRWIFFVNLPISVLAIVMTLRFVAVPPARRSRGVDLPGMAAFTVAAGAATYALIKGSDNGWGSATTLGLFGLAAVALLAFLLIEKRRREPLLDLSLFRQGSFSGLMVAAVLLSVAAFSYLAYTSLWLQSVRGMGPVTAGLTCLPMSLAAFLVASLSGRFLHGASPRWTVGPGLLLIGAGAFLQATIDADSSWTVLVPGLAVTGVGVGLATPMLASAALASVAPERGGMASGAVNTARQLGNALGIAVLGVVFHAGMTGALRDHGKGAVADPAATADALAGGQAGAVIAHAGPAERAAAGRLVHDAFATGLQQTFLVSGALGVLGGLVAVALVRRPKAPAAWRTERPAAAVMEAEPARP
ncbi:multidrug MFS transporter [Streptomyces eurocidicus]|uniref:EmrB/QacA subfamily drug resistance transporter n=1 Tax=Streptomyces eurocidicus TaxID=66423 RepID=A0A2N8P0K9_STREU|nr:MFS transporter [Streptomyces eurocidicus]MBB5122026.1 EmrB/QacA subfamily drug resistance transporter [Streptomyces eurocidicus]MBF6055361.1 DHA2 family efflux MFS transporter permease subunit [Streptomyces eurocidicus]PNE34552.1 multidrug MFS transporter [Streptomyces eurocidicus]